MGVEFIQLTPHDFDDFGCECYQIEWEDDYGTYQYPGIQEVPITPTITHIYDVNTPQRTYIGAISTDDDEEYLQMLTNLIHDYLS